MKKHIEITWSNGEKTVETYSPDVRINDPVTAEEVYRVYCNALQRHEVKPVSYRELD